MSSAELDFNAVLLLAKEENPPDFTGNLALKSIHKRLDLRIRNCRIISLFVRRRSNQHILNHAAFYVELIPTVENLGGVIRFSMGTNEEMTTGETPGTLSVKLHTFFGEPFDTVFFLSRPWLSDTIITLRDLVTFMDTARLSHFMMGSGPSGCRQFVYGLSKLLIECHCFNLDCAHTSHENWGTIKTKPGQTAEDLRQELAKKSIPRLSDILSFYYTREGTKIAMPQLGGYFTQKPEHGLTVLHQWMMDR